MIKLQNITARKATLNDLKDIIVMAYDFYVEFIGTEYGDFDFDTVGKLAANTIVGKNQEIFLISDPEVGNVGMFYIYLAPTYYNPKVMTADAHHLYLKPEYRNTSAVKVMITAIKEWAKNKKTFWLRQGVTKENMKFKIYKGEEQCQLHQQSAQPL